MGSISEKFDRRMVYFLHFDFYLTRKKEKASPLLRVKPSRTHSQKKYQFLSITSPEPSIVTSRVGLPL
jgi:hypothetical protein